MPKQNGPKDPRDPKDQPQRPRDPIDPERVFEPVGDSESSDKGDLGKEFAQKPFGSSANPPPAVTYAESLLDQKLNNARNIGLFLGALGGLVVGILGAEWHHYRFPPKGSNGHAAQLQREVDGLHSNVVTLQARLDLVSSDRDDYQNSSQEWEDKAKAAYREIELLIESRDEAIEDRDSLAEDIGDLTERAKNAENSKRLALEEKAFVEYKAVVGKWAYDEFLQYRSNNAYVPHLKSLQTSLKNAKSVVEVSVAWVDYVGAIALEEAKAHKKDKAYRELLKTLQDDLRAIKDYEPGVNDNYEAHEAYKAALDAYRSGKSERGLKCIAAPSLFWLQLGIIPQARSSLDDFLDWDWDKADEEPAPAPAPKPAPAPEPKPKHVPKPAPAPTELPPVPLPTPAPPKKPAINWSEVKKELYDPKADWYELGNHAAQLTTAPLEGVAWTAERYGGSWGKYIATPFRWVRKGVHYGLDHVILIGNTGNDVLTGKNQKGVDQAATTLFSGLAAYETYDVVFGDDDHKGGGATPATTTNPNPSGSPSGGLSGGAPLGN